MGFIDQLVFAPNAGQIALLKVIIFFASLLFVPFVSLLLGGSLLSVGLKISGLTHHDNTKIRFATDITDKLFGNVGVGLIIAFVPCLGLAIMYSQMLYNAHSSMPTFLFIASFMVFLAILLLYRFRAALMSNRFAPEGSSDELLAQFRDSNNKIALYTGLSGSALLILGTYFFVCSVTQMLVPAWWNVTPLELFFKGTIVTKYLAFLGGAFGVTGSAILFFFYFWGDGVSTDEGYDTLVKNTSGVVGIVGVLTLAVFTFWNMTIIPARTITFSGLIWSVVALVFLFVVCHTLYYAMKYKEFKIGGAGFILFLVAFLAMGLADSATNYSGLAKYNYKLEKAAEEANPSAAHH